MHDQTVIALSSGEPTTVSGYALTWTATSRKLVPAGDQPVDDLFGYSVVFDRDDDVYIPGEPRFTPSGHGEPANQRPAEMSPVEIRGDPPERRFDAVHSNRRDGRPGKSP